MSRVAQPDSSDPHDPLAPRSDEPRIGRWWWARRLYAREGPGRPVFFRWPIVLTAAMLLVSLFALAVASLIRRS